jgi:hypothetical protein
LSFAFAAVGDPHAVADGDDVGAAALPLQRALDLAEQSTIVVAELDLEELAVRPHHHPGQPGRVWNDRCSGLWRDVVFRGSGRRPARFTGAFRERPTQTAS